MEEKDTRVIVDLAHPRLRVYKLFLAYENKTQLKLNTDHCKSSATSPPVNLSLVSSNFNKNFKAQLSCPHLSKLDSHLPLPIVVRWSRVKLECIRIKKHLVLEKVHQLVEFFVRSEKSPGEDGEQDLWQRVELKTKKKLSWDPPKKWSGYLDNSASEKYWDAFWIKMVSFYRQLKSNKKIRLFWTKLTPAKMFLIIEICLDC